MSKTQNYILRCKHCKILTTLRLAAIFYSPKRRHNISAAEKGAARDCMKKTGKASGRKGEALFSGNRPGCEKFGETVNQIAGLEILYPIILALQIKAVAHTFEQEFIS